MQTIVVASFGGADQLRLVERPAPSPAAGEALIAVEAVGVGYVDVMAREGRYPLIKTPGFIPGAEVAGQVEAVGEGVPPEWVGERVFARTSTGAYAQKVAAPVSRLARLPDSVSAATAVALGVNALVAHFALERVRLQPAEAVLVRGAGGGIGVMTVQLAHGLGADVTAVTSSVARGERLAALGARQILNRKAQDEADLGDFDVVVDTVGGAELGRRLEKLKPNGRYILCGGAGGMPAADFGQAVLTTFHRSPSFYALSLNSIDDAQLRTAARTLFKAAAEGRLEAVIDQTLPLGRAGDAHRRLEAGQVFGKLVLTP
jgi:NADPH2:quinone reductase